MVLEERALKTKYSKFPERQPGSEKDLHGGQSQGKTGGELLLSSSLHAEYKHLPPSTEAGTQRIGRIFQKAEDVD